MDRHFDESWFEPNTTNQQDQPAPAHPQNTPQQNITNDLLDIFSPTSAQTNSPQKTQITSEPPLIDLLSDTPYTNASTPSSTPGYSHLSMSEYTPHSLIDTSNTSPSSYNKSTYQKAVPHYVNLNQVPASFTATPKENFTGIYGFFGSKELPPTTKQISLSDIPAGLEAIPFIFQNKCYYQGLGLLDQYMKLAPTPEEKMYYKILKIMCLIKQGMWDGVTSEFSSIGNLEKMMTEPKHEIYLPYHLRLLYALAPFLSAPLQHKSSSSSSAPKGFDEKTLDRLFQLYYFCENKAGEINESDLYHDENVDMFTICDADISPQQWAARLFRVTLLIIEILLFKTSSRAAHEVIKNAMQKFPRNEILMAYMIRLKQLEGDFKDARFFLDKINEKLPKDEHLEFILFNTFAQSAYEMKFPEAKKLLEELAQKYPQYSTLAYNNLAYLFIAEGQIEKAIKILEDLIRTEPWNINEVICLNLIYLYDFYYVDSKNRKRVLEEIVDRYAMNFSRASIAHELRS